LKGLWLKKEKKIGYVAEGSVSAIGKPVNKKAKLPKSFVMGTNVTPQYPHAYFKRTMFLHS
jgi:hypothetical protein